MWAPVKVTLSANMCPLWHESSSKPPSFLTQNLVEIVPKSFPKTKKNQIAILNNFLIDLVAKTLSFGIQKSIRKSIKNPFSRPPKGSKTLLWSPKSVPKTRLGSSWTDLGSILDHLGSILGPISDRFSIARSLQTLQVGISPSTVHYSQTSASPEHSTSWFP